MAASRMQVLAVGFLLFVTAVTCFDDEFEGQRTLTLEHSLERGSEPEFSKRGTVVIRSVKNNKAVFSQLSPLTTAEKLKLQELAKGDGVYRIRIPVKGNGEDGDFVSTFSRACCVYESALSDILTVSVDQSGEVLGISMVTVPGHCAGIEVPMSNITDWNTSVEISQTVQGPMPDTNSYIEKMKREESDKAKGQQGDNRSFFSKYWMYIVPFVIMMLVMQSMDPGQGQGGGGGR